METNIKNSCLSSSELILNTSIEQSIDCDALLPDYCPDIIRILKTKVNPIISNNSVNGNNFVIDGLTEVTIYYIGSGGCISKAEYKIPFTKNIELKKECQSYSYCTNTSVIYINSRAINQRRIDIRGAFEINTKVIGINTENLISDIDADGIHLLKENINTCKIDSNISLQLRTTEDIEPIYDKPPIADILRVDATSTIIDSIPENDKINIKGDIHLKIFYFSQENSYEKMEFSIPFNCTLNSDKITQNSKYFITSKILSAKCECINNGSNNIGVDIITEINANVCNEETIDICKDCYSTKYKCNHTLNNINTMFLKDKIEKAILKRETIDIPEDIVSVLDIWCEIIKIDTIQKPDGMYIHAKINICIFTTGKENEIFYFEKPLEVNEQISSEYNNIILMPTYNILSCDYQISSNKSIEVRIEIKYDSPIYIENTISGISNIEIDENELIDNPIPKGLYIYYPEKEESVWEIAKKYNTSPEKISEENNENENNIIIIPVI